MGKLDPITVRDVDTAIIHRNNYYYSHSKKKKNIYNIKLVDYVVQYAAVFNLHDNYLFRYALMDFRRVNLWWVLRVISIGEQSFRVI